MKVYFNETINLDDGEQVWSAKNGAKRRTLVLINKTGVKGRVNCLEAQVSVFEKGNHSFIFLNPPKAEDNRIKGIYLNSYCGYDVVYPKDYKPPFEACSVGGPGNKMSQFGVYDVGVIIKEYSYKHRAGETYYKLTESGWECLGTDVVLPELNEQPKEI